MDNQVNRRSYYSAMNKRRRRRMRRQNKKLRIVPLTILGIIIFAVVLVALVLLWGALSFFTNGSLSSEGIVSVIMYYIALTCATVAVSFLGKGSSFLPAVLVTAAASIASILLAGWENVSWLSFLLKTGGGIVIAGITAMIASIYYGKKRQDINETHELRF